MDSAVIGFVGVIAGLAFGGTGKYFNQRRDAWLGARAAGLLLLADVETLRSADRTDQVVAETRLGTSSWEAQRQTLASFRRGSYPNGLTASEWLTLARHFAQLKKIHSTRGQGWWDRAQGELLEVERLLAGFKHDPAVLSYVIRHGWQHNTARTVLLLSVLLAACLGGAYLLIKP